MSNKSGRIVWIAAVLTFLLQLYLTGFFTFGDKIPLTVDVNPGNYKLDTFSWPPHGSFATSYFLGFPAFPKALEPASLFARGPVWLFFTVYFPLIAALSLLACAALLRELGFSPAVSALGGVIYAWQGDLLGSLFPGHFPDASIWMAFPLALYFALRCCRTGGWFFAACCGAFTGLMVLSLPDRGGICSLVVGAFFLMEIFRRRKENPFQALKIAAQLLLVIFVALLIALPGLLTIFQTQVVDVGPSAPQDIKEKFNWATQWSFAPEDIITYPVPGFLGWYQDDPAGPYWGRIGQSAQWLEKHEGLRNFCQVSFSIGTIASLLALIGLVQLGRASEPRFSGEQRIYGRFFAVVAGVGLVLALGRHTPAYFYFFKLPFMDKWRDPLKFHKPLNLALVILAAYGAHLLAGLLTGHAQETEKTKIRVQFRLGWLTVFSFALWLLSFVLVLPLAVHLASLGFTEEQRAQILSTINLALFIVAFCLGFIWLAWRIFSWPGPLRHRSLVNPLAQKIYDLALSPSNLGCSWIVACMIAVVGQMFWVQGHYMQLHDYKAMYAPNPLLDKLRPETGESPFRVKIEMSDSLLYQYLSTTFPWYGISSLDIPAVSRMPEDYAVFFEALQKNNVRLLQLAGVRYFLMPAPEVMKIKNDAALAKNVVRVFYCSLMPEARPGEPTHALVEMRDYFPKATLVFGLETLPDSSAILHRLGDPAWNCRETILARAGEPGVPAPRPPLKREPPLVRLKQYNDHTIELEADTPEPACLLINDRYNPGWKATLNGASAAIFRADYILRGLALPAGHSTVVMRFEPLLFDRIPPAWPIYGEIAAWFLLACFAMARCSLLRRAA
jgi:hypothetical protein